MALKVLKPEHVDAFMEFLQFGMSILIPKVLNSKEIEDFYDGLVIRCAGSGLKKSSSDEFIEAMRISSIEMRKIFKKE